MRLNFTIAILLMAAGSAQAADPKPSEEDATKLLEQARETALNYSRSLPDFICTQVVKRYVDVNGRDRWMPTDTLTIKLSYFGQKEDYKLLLIDNKPTKLDYTKAGGAFSKGEFGTMLRLIFDPASATAFHWKSWTTVRKRRAAVYSYHVERPHSTYTVSVQTGGDNMVEALVGFHGEIFVDRDTDMVLHMTTEAELPVGFPMKESLTSLDYDFTAVGGREYLLPLSAVVEMRSSKLHTKNSVAFHSYQKFHSDTTISFDTATDKPQD